MTDERHTGRSELIDADPLSADGERLEARRRLEQQDLAFRRALSDAIRSGAEPLRSVLGLRR